MEYTKGEWAYKSAGDGNISIYRTGDWYCGIADVLGDDAEAIANANLIAASKDLYEELKSLNEALSEELHDAKDEATIARFEGYIRQIESVLAKAEGKKQ